jgi:hypothetical protein
MSCRCLKHSASIEIGDRAKATLIEDKLLGYIPVWTIISM